LPEVGRGVEDELGRNSDMASARKWLFACLLAGVVPQAGCATIIGTAISPITGPIDVVTGLSDGHLQTDGFWDAAWKVPVLIILSPVAGCLTGMGVDYEIIESQRWPIWGVLQPFHNLPMH
jgi:hypothetical protein